MCPKMCSRDSGAQSVCIMCRHPISSANSFPPLDSCSGTDAKLCSTLVDSSYSYSVASHMPGKGAMQHICNQCLSSPSSNSQQRQRHLRPSRTCYISSCNNQQSPFEVCPLIRKFAHQISKMSFNGNLLLTFFLYAILFASQVTCDGTFELRLDRFANEHNRDASGQCCGHNLSTIANYQTCEQKCQTYFRVCFTNYQANIDLKQDCRYGQSRTPVLLDDQISGHTIQFPFNFTWTETFSLIIEAWNNVSAIAPAEHGKTDMLIGRYYLQRPNALTVGKHWTHASGLQNQTAIHFSFRVLCPKNYYGKNCSITCNPRNDVHGHYECGPDGPICHQGWTGKYCDKAICDRCNTTNGQCVAPGKCECRHASGWGGEDCNQCERYPGCQHGTCRKPMECICDEGWGGLMCNKDLNYCTNNQPCKNNGLCSNTGEGSFTCTCQPGFAGINCETKVDVCESSPCQNGATCKSNGISNYTCECPIGFHGHNCDQIDSACSKNPCENEGTCVDGPSGFQCFCKRGYSGNKCEIRQKDCMPNPCLNGGNCVANSTLSDDGGYTCQCRAGFTGDHCEVNINDCESNPCLNGGKCSDEVNSFRCLCVPGFVGELCQKNVDDCLMKPCANGGRCEDRINDYICRCPSGYTGKDCSINIDDCASNPCRHGATCRDLVDGFECTCSLNFYGSRCEFSNSTNAYWTESEKTDSPFPKGQIGLIVFASISLPLIVIISLVMFILCRQWKRHDFKMKSRRDEDEARRQNEHNSVMSGLNNKCLDQCLNPSAANVIVNALDQAPSLHHLNKCHNYQNKVTNEYVYGRQFNEKSGTLQKDYKLASPYKAINTDLQVKLSPMDDPYYHTYEHIQKPSNLLATNIANQQIYQQVHAPKQSNLDIYSSPTVVVCPDKSNCPAVMTSRPNEYGQHHNNNNINNNNEPNAKAHTNLQNNIQIAATLQRMGCRSNSIYVIENHYSQPIYNDPKKLQATEV